jgi:hypothetical protein
MRKKEERVRRKNGRQGGAENKSEHTKELGYCDPLWKWLIGFDSNTRLEKFGFVPTFPNPIANHPVEVVELFLQLDSQTLLISPPKRL